MISGFLEKPVPKTNQRLTFNIYFYRKGNLSNCSLTAYLFLEGKGMKD
jgi:hypothetical protein